MGPTELKVQGDHVISLEPGSRDTGLREREKDHKNIKGSNIYTRMALVAICGVFFLLLWLIFFC